MLNNEDHPGLFPFIVGMIVLVFTGVGLSIIVERRFGFARHVTMLEREIHTGELELEELKEIYHERSRDLAAIEPKLRAEHSALQSLQSRMVQHRIRRKVHAMQRDELQNSITVLEEEFSRYRAQYREITRNGVIGLSLDTLITRGGRQYNEAVISRVTDEGLEIRHENGTARLQATDLDASLQERFQWDDESRRARLREEHAAHASAERVSEVPSPVPIRQPDLQSKRVHERGNLQEVETLRARVIGWKSKIAQVRQQRDHALAAAYGSRSSSTGGLETWEQKAVRLGKELARLEGALAVAKADLARIAPNDPLLSKHPATR